MRRFDIEVGHCSQCQRRVQGRHALQTSDALGAAGAQLGPGVVALVVELHTEMGVPLAKVAHVLRTTFGLQVTPGGLSHLLHRTARDAAPTYTALCEQVRNSPVVTPDETGWRVAAISHWLWAFVTPETTVYAICPSRGFDDATTVLGADFAGVLVRDGWVSYRCYRAALHQSCLNHLLRRCKELQEDHPDSLWAGQVQAVLQTGLAVRDRCNDGELSEHGLASVRGRLVAQLGRLIDAPPPLDDTERFARHLATEFAAVFLFLWDLSVDATNWRAEQAIRPAVVIRKVCGGNRTRHGADSQQVLASVVRTARQRDLDLPPLIATMLRATGPVVPDAFGLPPPPACVADALLPVVGRKRVRQPSQPLAQQRVDLLGRQAVGQPLHRRGVRATQDAVVERLEPDAPLRQLPLQILVPVDAQLRVVGEVRTELQEERPEVVVDRVEVVMVHQCRRVDQPRVGGPGGRAPAALGALHARLLLRLADVEDTLAPGPVA